MTYVLIVYFFVAGYHSDYRTQTAQAAVTVAGYQNVEACQKAAEAVSTANPRARGFCIPGPQ